MPADAPAVTRTPCTHCVGQGWVERESSMSWMSRGQAEPDYVRETCGHCKGAGAWEQRSLPWEALEGSCAVSAEGTVVAAPASTTARISVPGGWLVRSVQYFIVNDGGGVGVGLTFVPDAEHTWAPHPRRTDDR